MNSIFDTTTDPHYFLIEHLKTFFQNASVFQHLSFLKRWRKLMLGSSRIQIAPAELVIRHRQLEGLFNATIRYTQLVGSASCRSAGTSMALQELCSLFASEYDLKEYSSLLFEWLLESLEGGNQLTKGDTKKFYQICKRLVILCGEIHRLDSQQCQEDWF